MDNLWRWQDRLGLGVGANPAVPSREDVISHFKAGQRHARMVQLLSCMAQRVDTLSPCPLASRGLVSGCWCGDVKAPDVGSA